MSGPTTAHSTLRTSAAGWHALRSSEGRVLQDQAPEWQQRLTVTEGRRVRRRFWQPGGGYDRNITSIAALRAMIDYIHANPGRNGGRNGDRGEKRGQVQF